MNQVHNWYAKFFIFLYLQFRITNSGQDREIFQFIGFEVGKFQLSFTLLIAYAVPGLLGVYSLSLHFEPINYLFGLDTAHSSTTVIIPLTLLVLGAGIIINALTWAFLRPLIHLFGVKKPDLDYSKLTKDKIEQYNIIVESSYRYYQSYSNLLTSILILLIAIFTSQ